MSRWLMSLGGFVVGANVAVAFVAVANVVGGLCRVTEIYIPKYYDLPVTSFLSPLTPLFVQINHLHLVDV